MILQVDQTHTPGTLMGGETVKTVGLLTAGFLGGNNITWPCKGLCVALHFPIGSMGLEYLRIHLVSILIVYGK